MVKMMTVLAGLILFAGVSILEARNTPVACNDPFINPAPDVPICDQIAENVRCMLQDLGFDEEPDIPDDFIETFEEQLNLNLENFGLECDIDLGDIFEELRRQEPIPAVPDCVDDELESQCRGLVNGDYPICDSTKCAEGKFITCSNGILYVRDCALGWYRDDAKRFVAPTVYNPTSRTCDYHSPSCPRDLDNFVEG